MNSALKKLTLLLSTVSMIIFSLSVFGDIRKLDRNNMLRSERINGDTLILVGKIKKQNTKKGLDYYFETGKAIYYIKTSEGIFDATQLDLMMEKDKRPNAEYSERRFKVVLRIGNWDRSTDKGKGNKDRKGKYLAILRELRID